MHEKYPIIAPRSKDTFTNNNLFSIEPGCYIEGKFGLRVENLYVTKTSDKSLILKNITLVPYELDLIDFKLITNFERKYIKQYHKKIYVNFQSRLSDEYRNYFLKNLINKI